MQRFRQFLGQEINLERVKDAGKLSSYGITCTYLPDPPEDFDEFEFRTNFAGRELVITAVTELGKIQRVSFTVADQDNPEVTRSLSEEQVQELLAQKGQELEDFFKSITA